MTEQTKTPEKQRTREKRARYLSDTAVKLPPQALDLEESTLGAILLEKQALSEIISFIKPEIFYKESHQIIMTAILELFNQGEPVDILTVVERLVRMGKLETVGGAHYITQLTSRIASSANIEYHARIIYQKFLNRELIRIGSAAINSAYEDETDIIDLITTTEQQINELSEPGAAQSLEPLQVAALPVFDKLEKLRTGTLKFTGVPSGLIELDKATGGFQAGNLVIIAGRTSMGKSTLALNIAANAAAYGKKIAYYSLEMSKEELIIKVLAAKYKIEVSKLRHGATDEATINKMRDESARMESRIFIDDSALLNNQELRRSAVRLKAKEDINLVIVDYLQLMAAYGLKGYENREREISIISRSLKALAKELQLPVIALSQLSRAVETRGGNFRPRLSDLRESGAIENDADLVIFCYRPEYYKLEEIQYGGRPYSTAGAAIIDIAKGRNIGLKEVLCNFSGKFSSFTDYNENFQPDYDNTLFQEQEEVCPFG